jgi:HK97 family phage major capsid protein/HK97 family phage prohead protease
MNRAYSVLTVKAVEDDQRVITGIATTPAVDREGDIIEPMGVRFTNPLSLLHQHNSKLPVGTVKFNAPTKDGITFEARLPIIAEPGTLKDRVDTAWGEVKNGLVRGVSIGFRPIEYSFIENGGIRFTEIEVFELSLVTIPAQADAVISTIKSIDAPLLAAAGKQQSASDRPAPPGVPGSKPFINNRSTPKEGGSMPKTILEQIKAFEASRQAKAARMTEIMAGAADEGVTLNAEQTEEYDGLDTEVKSIDSHLKRLDALEKANKAAARPVDNVNSQESGSQARGGVVISIKSNLPKGTAFTRYAMALGRSKGNLMQAVEIAKGWHDSTPEVETVLKAAVAAGTTTDPSWAAPLVEYQVMASEFAELLRPATVIGRIQGLRRVPFNIKIPRQTGGSTIGWVGQGAPKPVSKLSFDQVSLGMAKTAGIVVMSDELVRSSNPSAEAIVRQDMIDQTAQFLDAQFVDPSVAAVADVSPASVTNGVVPVVASGVDADALRADAKALFGKFIAVNMSLATAVWIMTETQALSISLMTNPLGQPEFPGMVVNGVSGGTFLGLPVILSENIPANPGAGDPLAGMGNRILLAKASEILLADDGEVVLDASREASLQMDSAPTNPPTAATVLVSLWQMNLVALRAERFINWSKRRAGAVQYIDSARYGDAA